MHTYPKILVILSFLGLNPHFLAALAAAPDAKVDVFEPAVLRQLDVPGAYSFATILGAAQQEAEFLKKNAGNLAFTRLKIMRLSELTQTANPLYASLAHKITQDVKEIKTTSGEVMAYSSEQAELLGPSGNVARHFDFLWLKSAMAGFPLIGIINRLDRKDFAQNTCGEVRFIYRLAYYRAQLKRGSSGKEEIFESRSTLPLLLNVVFDVKPDAQGSCQTRAQQWQNSSPATDPAQQAQWLQAGPLAKEQIEFKQLELNMQIVRYPSGQKTDFGGQATYLFRIFKAENNTLVSIPLENTPDVAEILKSKELQQALLKQISDRANLAKIDRGTFVLQNSAGKLLATRALSFSTVGRARLANKPFTSILNANADEFKNLDYANLKFIKTPQGLIERLNNNTCMGCHQSGGTAGFHVLGLGGDLNSSFNQAALPFSAHYYAERSRRTQYVNNIAEGIEPNTFRPHSIFPPAHWSAELDPHAVPEFEQSKIRDLCVPNTNNFHKNGQCAAGSTCQITAENKLIGLAVGECVASSNVVAGHVCRAGAISSVALKMTPNGLYNLNASQDTIKLDRIISKAGLGCSATRTGVPLGRISKICNSNSVSGKLEFVDRLLEGQTPPPEICTLRGSLEFDGCARSTDPANCLAKASIDRALLDTCSLGQFCREDYICQKLPIEITRLYTGKDKELVSTRIKKLDTLGVGFCVPNYFLFNMRTDGHIIPEGH